MVIDLISLAIKIVMSLFYIISLIINFLLLNQVRAWFLKNCFCADICMCVCVSAPEAINNGGVMWRDIDPIQSVNQVLQLLYGNCSCYR